MYLQTKEGKNAHGLTSMEFEDVMETIKKDAENKLEDALRAAGLDKTAIKYSWDNDKIHKGANLARVGFTADMRLELPPLSSDMHMVIEHVHAQIQKHFDNWLWGFDVGKPTVQQCKDKVQEIFWGPDEDHQLITKDSITEDAHSLHFIYQAVINARGGYIAHKRE